MQYRLSGPNGTSGRIWWVNQGRSYEDAKRLGQLWAGLDAWHHKTMVDLQTGDLVFVYADQLVRAVCEVTGPAHIVRGHVAPGLPDSPPRDRNVASATYYLLRRPVPINLIPLEWRLENTTARHGPFQKSGSVHQVYLCQLRDSFYSKFREKFADDWPTSGG